MRRGIWLPLIIAVSFGISPSGETNPRPSPSGLAAAAAARCEATHDSLSRWDIVPELVIGGPDDTTLIAAQSVAVDAGGRMYVHNGGASVRIFNAVGKVLAVRGRWGEGPGDLNGPTAFGLIGDTIWVGDEFLEKIVRFLPK